MRAACASVYRPRPTCVCTLAATGEKNQTFVNALSAWLGALVVVVHAQQHGLCVQDSPTRSGGRPPRPAQRLICIRRDGPFDRAAGTGRRGHSVALRGTAEDFGRARLSSSVG